MLTLIFLLFWTAIANIDVPVIIDREFTRQLDPADFLIDYDAERPPNSSIKVDVIFDVKYLKWKQEALYIILELIQSWEDTRLTLPDEMSIFVPKEKKLWSPDSYFENAMEIEWQKEHSRRLNRGMVYEKRRIKLEVPCINQPNLNETDYCRNGVIIFGSFDNAAVKLVEYNITKIVFSKNLDCELQISYTTKQESVISSNGQKLNRILITIAQNITSLI